MKKLVIATDDAGQRLDRFLRKLLPARTLASLFKSIRTGDVRVNGRRAVQSLRLQAGDEVELRLPEPALAGIGSFRARTGPPRPLAKPLVVLHRDADVLAVDKPAFLLVQKGERADEPTLDEIVAEEFGRGDSLTFVPALAHRLDRGTSGIVLLGLSAAGLRGLTEAFRARRVDKRYLALVAGRPETDEFEIDLPLRREPENRRRLGAKVNVSHAPDALTAVTRFRVLAREPARGLALVEASPLTGRTHQIRAHLRAAKLPIVGDPTYGDPARNRAWREETGLRRQFLHAARVEFEHPVERGRRIVVESGLPEDLVRVLAAAGMAPPSPAGT